MLVKSINILQTNKYGTEIPLHYMLPVLRSKIVDIFIFSLILFTLPLRRNIASIRFSLYYTHIYQ